MRIVTANLNGIRGAARKGFFDWLPSVNADVICLQELKAQAVDLAAMPELDMAGYEFYFECAQKKGYSGVGILTRHSPKKMETRLGWPVADDEGRYLAIDLGNLWVVSLYLPSGTSGEERQAVKYQFLDHYEKHLRHLKQQQKNIIICGDWNIAHKAIDLKNWRGNQKNSGFLPEERAWMDKLFGELEFVDAFREVNQEPDQYTWWSNRGQARAKNVGWRIDYQVISPALRSTVKSATIYTKEKFSDHAPLVMDYDILI